MFQPPDEHVQEVDEGELYESSEHRHEADDDEHVKGGGVAHLGLGLAAKPDSDDGEDRGGAQLGPGGRLLALVRLDQPEGDPGAHHDDVQRNVDLESGDGQGRASFYFI